MHLGWPVGADRERGPGNTLLAKRVLYKRSWVGGCIREEGAPQKAVGWERVHSRAKRSSREAGPQSSAAHTVRRLGKVGDACREGLCTFFFKDNNHILWHNGGLGVSPLSAGRVSGISKERAQEARDGRSAATCGWISPSDPKSGGIRDDR